MILPTERIRGGRIASGKGLEGTLLSSSTGILWNPSPYATSAIGKSISMSEVGTDTGGGGAVSSLPAPSACTICHQRWASKSRLGP